MAQFLLYKGMKTFLDHKAQFRMTRYFRSPAHHYFVLGNSRAVNSIEEKYAVDSLHMSLINLSFNGEPYENVLDMLKEVNASNQNDTIYLEVTCLGNNEKDNGYSYYMDNSPVIHQRYASSIYDRIALLRLNNELFLRNLYYLRTSDNDWVNMNKITTAIIEGVSTSPEVDIMTNDTVFKARLKSMEELCQSHRNHLIFFLAPYYPSYLKKIKDYENLVAYMEANTNTYRFFDLNKLHFSDEMFADKVHTNFRGAVMLTDSLVTWSRQQ